MIVKRDYMNEAYERTTIEQIANDYLSRGYDVKLDVKVGKYRVDLRAEREGKTIYVEVKTHQESDSSRRRIKELTEYIKTLPNSKFIVAVSRYQEPVKIEFDELEQVLFEYFLLDMPSDLDALSTHTRPEDVTGVFVNEISIRNGEIYVSCKGSVGVNLQYGSDSEQEEGDEMYMSFPFRFKGTIEYKNGDYCVKDYDELKVDTDAFYE